MSTLAVAVLQSVGSDSDPTKFFATVKFAPIMSGYPGGTSSLGV